ncbi:MAG: PepSY-associated TM helix domain-containing protein, partial [Janthinobacterium lividum]
MSLFGTFIAHPRRVWLRRALFQIHLWVGVLFALYLIAISLSGAVLVFRQELTRWSLPPALHAYQPAHGASPEQVMQHFEQAEPGGSVALLQMPSPKLPAFLIQGKNSAGRPARWWADAGSAELQPAPRTWLDTVLDLHDYLLLPHAWGMQVNAAGAAALLLLAFTGILLWWPGLRVWTRGLRVNFR